MNSHWITSSLEHNGMSNVQEGPATILRGGGGVEGIAWKSAKTSI